MTWTAEDAKAFDEREAADSKITADGNKALRKHMKDTRHEELKDYFEEFLDQVTDSLDLWAMSKLLVAAYSSGSLFEGLRSILWVRGTEVLRDSFKGNLPEPEPGDDNVFAGTRCSNITYPEDAAKDTSWINETPKVNDFTMAAQAEDGEWQQALNMSRGEYKKLKWYLAELRGLDTKPTTAA